MGIAERILIHSRFLQKMDPRLEEVLEEYAMAKHELRYRHHQRLIPLFEARQMALKEHEIDEDFFWEVAAMTCPMQDSLPLHALKITLDPDFIIKLEAEVGENDHFKASTLVRHYSFKKGNLKHAKFDSFRHELYTCPALELFTDEPFCYATFDAVYEFYVFALSYFVRGMLQMHGSPFEDGPDE